VTPQEKSNASENHPTNGEFFGAHAPMEGNPGAHGAHSTSLTGHQGSVSSATTLPRSTLASTSTSGAGTIPIEMPRGRFAQAVHNMLLMQRAAGMSQLALDSPARRRTHSDGVLSGSDAGPASAVRSNRLAALTPKLQCLETTQDLAAHSALVRHLMFSPDGKYLATCR
jgi:WD repeat-containing protein 26